MPKATKKTNRPCSDEEDQDQVGVVILRNNSNVVDDRCNEICNDTSNSNTTTSVNIPSDPLLAFESEPIPFYDTPCTTRLSLSRHDLANVEHWLQTGFVDAADLPYLRSITNLSLKCKEILEGWEGFFNCSQGVNDLETPSWKREVDKFMDYDPPSPHGESSSRSNRLTNEIDWQTDSGAGPYYESDLDADDEASQYDRPNVCNIREVEVSQSDRPNSYSNHDLNVFSDSDSDFETHRPKRKRKFQKGKGRPVKKRKLVPVKSNKPYDWQKKKDQSKAKARYLVRNKSRFEKIKAKKKQCQKGKAIPSTFETYST